VFSSWPDKLDLRFSLYVLSFSANAFIDSSYFLIILSYDVYTVFASAGATINGDPATFGCDLRFAFTNSPGKTDNGIQFIISASNSVAFLNFYCNDITSFIL